MFQFSGQTLSSICGVECLPKWVSRVGPQVQWKWKNNPETRNSWNNNRWGQPGTGQSRDSHQSSFSWCLQSQEIGQNWWNSDARNVKEFAVIIAPYR